MTTAIDITSSLEAKSGTAPQVASTNQGPPSTDEYATGKEDEVKKTKSLLYSSDNNTDCNKVYPVNPPKIHKVITSTLFTIGTTKKLQVLAPISCFAHIKVHSLVPENLINFFDDSDDSNEDIHRTLVELVKKNKKRRRRLLRAVKKLNVSLDKECVSVKKKPTNLLETVKQDVADQKKVSEPTFTGVESLYIFRKDLHTEALARQGWMSLLTIQLADGSKVSILDNSVLLGKANLESANRDQLSDLQLPATNI